MRYIKTKKYNFFTHFKFTMSMILIAAVTFSIIKIYGRDIVNSAFEFTFCSTNASFDESLYAQANFENDFLTFVDYKETETAPLPTVTPQKVQSNNDAIAVNLSALSGKYKTYNGTSVINNTKYDISSLLYADYHKPQLNKNDPYVLIYHTHTSEAYYGGGTVVDVGNALAEEFENLGYKTIHLTEVYDKEQFSGAYSRSIKGVEKALEENPGITLVFDVHRDAITAENGDTYRPVTTIDDKTSAQVMFVCGTDEKGLSHPNWRENFKFALDVSRTMGKNYGALSRPVNLRGDRFNTHTTKFSFLMEIGSEANTLKEAELAAIMTARSVVSTIEKTVS